MADVEEHIKQAEALIKSFKPSVSTVDAHIRDTLGDIDEVRAVNMLDAGVPYSLPAHNHAIACAVHRTTMEWCSCSNVSTDACDTRRS